VEEMGIKSLLDQHKPSIHKRLPASQQQSGLISQLIRITAMVPVSISLGCNFDHLPLIQWLMYFMETQGKLSEFTGDQLPSLQHKANTKPCVLRFFKTVQQQKQHTKT